MKQKIRGRLVSKKCSVSAERLWTTCCFYVYQITDEFLFFHRPYVILEIGVAVLVVVFLFYFLITRGNPPKDVLFFGN